jgi:hypothetical protein
MAHLLCADITATDITEMSGQSCVGSLDTRQPIAEMRILLLAAKRGPSILLLLPSRTNCILLVPVVTCGGKVGYKFLSPLPYNYNDYNVLHTNYTSQCGISMWCNYVSASNVNVILSLWYLILSDPSLLGPLFG